MNEGRARGTFAALGERIGAVLGTALILLFFSEYLFLNETSVESLIHAGPRRLPVLLAEMAGWYSLFAYVFLITLACFSVSSPAALFLAGSILGWAIEALVVPVAHEAPPVSWIFPSIGWHGAVDTMLGWYLMRQAMRRLPWPALVAAFMALGAFWGGWASWFWQGAAAETVPAPLSLGAFARLATIAAGLWISGMILADRTAARAFLPGRWETGIVAILSVALFVQTGLAFLPGSAGLAALIALTFATLKRGQRLRPAGSPDCLQALRAPPGPARHALAVLVPLTAVATYALVLRFDLALPSELINAALLIGGAMAYVGAMWRVARGR